MGNRILSIPVLLVVLASALIGCVQGSTPALTILSITEGDVFVMKAGTDTWTEGEVEMNLEVGDRIKTGDDSSAEITFFDGSTIELEAGTEIEILSLDVSPDSNVTTINLEQIIGTTISRVTALLDPASSYEIETPTGTAAVRGSEMIVTVGEDGTTWITNEEGNIEAIAQGVVVQIPEGEQCIMMPGQPPNLVPVAADDTAVTNEHTPVTIDVLNNDYDLDGDALTLVSATNGTHGSVINNGSNVTYTPALGFDGNDSFTYTVSDGKGGTDNATVSVTVSRVTAMVAAGDYHTVGLSSNVTVVAVGRNSSGQCNVGGWTGIIQIAGGAHHTVGLTSDGAAVAVGRNDVGQCNVGGWTNITQVAAGNEHTVGLSSNGTTVAAGSNYYGQCDIGGWTNVTQVAAGGWHTVGLESDGTLVAVGYSYYGQCGIGGWTGIIQLAAGGYHTVGLESDGTVVAVGESALGQCGVGNWTDIIQVAAGFRHTVGLKSDGTVVAVGESAYGQCGVAGWVDIIQVTAGYRHTVGLKSDGTVVTVGLNLDGQCNVAGWDLY
jgi:hypothetical protein